MSLNRLSAQSDTTHIEIYDNVVFYDGYRYGNNPDSLLNDGVLRHSCSLYSTRLYDEMLDQLGDEMWMNVYVTACCDNYDRIGNVNIAFVPKNSDSYSTSDVERIEIGRFITPFMNKNKSPKTVPYRYDMAYLSQILRDRKIRESHDLWLELEIFGIPYDANQKISGCQGRSDVFQGTLDFETTGASELVGENVIVPIVIKKPEYIGNNLNNYNENATDTLGKTTKTYFFDVPEDVDDAQIVLITSNHGANQRGEEYNRRWHYVYYDDELMLSYKPGRQSCEPFRVYNTQQNGIYGLFTRSDASWQESSNWCPGDVIDNRFIALGAVKAGPHSIRISVPEAEFVNKQGDIPVSMYFHGMKNGIINTGIVDPTVDSPIVNIVLRDNHIIATAECGILSIDVHNVQGELLHRQWDPTPIDTHKFIKGIYLVRVELDNGIIETQKVIIN